jgi:hypothetical protein
MRFSPISGSEGEGWSVVKRLDEPPGFPAY